MTVVAQDLVQLVRHMEEAVKRRDLDAIAAIPHPDIEWIPRRAPIEGVYRGREAFIRFFDDTFATFDVFVFDIDEIRPLDDARVLVVGELRTQGHGSGAETRVPNAGVGEYRDGLLRRFQNYSDRESALAALGLDE